MKGKARQSGRGDALRIADVQEAVRLLLDIRAGGRDRFRKDPIVKDAVIRRLEVLGEAAGHVSDAVRTRYPEIPWRKMRGFASFAKHEYWRLDPDKIWAALETMPRLEKALAQVRVRDVPPGQAGRLE